MISNKKHILICYPIIFVLFIFDQITKLIFTGIYTPLISNVISIHYSQNTGAAWSIFSGNVVILAIVSSIFVAILIVFSHKFKEKNAFYSVSYALIIAGAFGNLFDRIVFGYVRDFIKADFITFTDFPIFNLADSFLVLGVVMFSIFVIFVYPKISEKVKK